MKNNVHQNYTRWSIRRLSVGVASVVVASGFFMITSPANSVLAKEGNVTPVTQTTQNKVDKEKESKSDDVNKLIKNAVDTVLTNSNDSSTSPQATESTTNKPIENKVEDRAATPAAETRTNSETPATIEETKPEQVKVAVQNNVKESIDVPAAYLEKAEGVGPFTAGVNQVIPYEFFAGDGMLTRLLLKASDKAPWSDNGTAKNPALSPLGENINTKGQYFYEVDLNGNTTGKEGQALLDLLRANGDHTYDATVKVYGNKDGKADLSNVIAERKVKIHLNKVLAPATTPSSSTNTTQEMNKMSTPKEDMMAKENTSKQEVKSTMKENLNKAKEEMKSPMMAHQKTTSQDMMKKDNMSTLPETGETATNTAALGAFSAAFAFILGTLGLKAKKERN